MHCGDYHGIDLIHCRQKSLFVLIYCNVDKTTSVLFMLNDKNIVIHLAYFFVAYFSVRPIFLYFSILFYILFDIVLYCSILFVGSDLVSDRIQQRFCY